jgi:SRSO17 transposase
MPGKRARPVRREAARKKGPAQQAPRRAADPSHTTKNETGLDHYQVRQYQAWYRHITLSMAAAAFLVITRDAVKKGAPTTNPN